MVLLIELVLVVTDLCVAPGGDAHATPAAPASRRADLNTEALGRVLYTQYVYYFQAAGLILLVAMIGAIVLTLRHKAGVKRQDIAEQIAADQGDGRGSQEGSVAGRACEDQRMTIGLATT